MRHLNPCFNIGCRGSGSRAGLALSHLSSLVLHPAVSGGLLNYLPICTAFPGFLSPPYALLSDGWDNRASLPGRLTLRVSFSMDFISFPLLYFSPAQAVPQPMVSCSFSSIRS